MTEKQKEKLKWPYVKNEKRQTPENMSELYISEKTEISDDS
jgi:hypothetical protein